jgi:hypothetical protein
MMSVNSAVKNGSIHVALLSPFLKSILLFVGEKIASKLTVLCMVLGIAIGRSQLRNLKLNYVFGHLIIE